MRTFSNAKYLARFCDALAGAVNDAVARDAITFRVAGALSSATEIYRVLRLAHNAHIFSAEMVRAGRVRVDAEK